MSTKLPQAGPNWTRFSPFTNSEKGPSGESGQERQKLGEAARLSIVVLNLALSLLFYTDAYQPAGTIKRSWTEVLG